MRRRALVARGIGGVEGAGRRDRQDIAEPRIGDHAHFDAARIVGMHHVIGSAPRRLADRIESHRANAGDDLGAGSASAFGRRREFGAACGDERQCGGERRPDHRDRHRLFQDFVLRMILSENRFPLFGIMRPIYEQ